MAVGEKMSLARLCAGQVLKSLRAEKDPMVVQALLENGRLVEDEAGTRAVANAGMVSAAVLSDLDGDGYPELILADWHGYSLTRPDWLTADGVHLTVPGARAAAG
jgi:hypothetical protein